MMVIIGAGLALAGFSILLGFLVVKAAAALTRAIARGMSNRRARKQMAGGYNPGAYQSEGGYQNYSAQQDGFTEAGSADGFAQTAETESAAPADSESEAPALGDSMNTDGEVNEDAR